MARKPKVIETPGDVLPADQKPVSAAAAAATKLMEKPQPDDADEILERRAGWVLTKRGWCKG
ncbi:hypothetical protein [Enterobacter bugandensis]|uniref:hypothetical protein n=1 Tax=Enterobacter bugandensis TaxID=881260 RepID=UPI00200364EF|nr:hypothetical protein [Enterobacter bugandensis]MCK7435908.1 hypothetical protein [Enterobacter bugandensis]